MVIIIVPMWLPLPTQAQTRDYRAGIITVANWIETLRGAPMINEGYYRQQYRGSSTDAMFVNYTGSGHYAFRVQGGGSDAFTVDKTGKTRVLGALTAFAGLDLSEDNIINVGNISLDTISSDAETTVSVVLGGDPGDDFIVDTTTLVVESDNARVGIKAADPDTLLELSEESVDTVATISTYHDVEATTPTLTLRKADNTRTSPQPVDQNAILGTVNFNGYDNDSFDTGAAIYSKADANWGATERGTDIFFQTRDGAGGLTDQFKVTAGGDFEGVTSKWWYCSYISTLEVSPGGSGATWTAPDANTVGGYQLDNANEYLYFSIRICPNWDEASDIGLGILLRLMWITQAVLLLIL